MKITNKQRIEIIEHFTIMKNYIFNQNLIITKIAKNLMIEYNLVKHEVIKYKINHCLILESKINKK